MKKPIKSVMTVREAKACVRQIREHIGDVRTLLLDLYNREGWQALGYSSWRECVAFEFGQSQAYLYRQLKAAEIEMQISPMGEKGNLSERVLRPLSKLSPEERRAAYERARETAGGEPTAADVEEEVAEAVLVREALDTMTPEEQAAVINEQERRTVQRVHKREMDNNNRDAVAQLRRLTLRQQKILARYDPVSGQADQARERIETRLADTLIDLELL